MVLRVKGPEYTTRIEGFDVVTAAQSGYAIYSVDKSNGSTSAALHDLGRVCLTGGKATFSYDERWLVFHHYVLPSDAVDLGFTGPDDPGFASYLSQGSSNLVLVDLRTGTAQRLTTLQPGQYALFPHFRSDGWIYFVVRTLSGEEYYAASDAALVSEAAH
jgi:Tol biopolymer transport system component